MRQSEAIGTSWNVFIRLYDLSYENWYTLACLFDSAGARSQKSHTKIESEEEEKYWHVS